MLTDPIVQAALVIVVIAGAVAFGVTYLLPASPGAHRAEDRDDVETHADVLIARLERELRWEAIKDYVSTHEARDPDAAHAAIADHHRDLVKSYLERNFGPVIDWSTSAETDAHGNHTPQSDRTPAAPVSLALSGRGE